MSAAAGRLLTCVLTMGICACAAPGPAGKMRFTNQAPVRKVNDRADTKKPKDRPFVRLLYHTDAPFFRRITTAMEVLEPRRAMNVSSLGEVPDSTWFTNRIGVRDMTPEEVAHGPNVGDGPDDSGPWKVRGTKIGGQSVGFLIEDARGMKFLLKFDEPDYPVIETATDVVVQRLLWAAGYNVPEDSVVRFDRSRLVLAEDAVVKDVFGNARPMKLEDLEGALGKVRRDPDGRFRGLVSRFLPGIPIGGFPQRGVREDDPNDLIPHEHRRELRGLYVFYGWLKCTDVKENNTLDVWEADPEDPKRHYVVHYLVDFGKSLGANATIARLQRDGHQYLVDIVGLPKALLGFGLFRRPWDGIPQPPIEGVGMFDVAHFDPGGFRPHDPYAPFQNRDRFDAFWAAKILARFERAHIRAAVEQGGYTDPRAVEYIVETLWGRARKAARYWLERVNPLDGFEVARQSNGHRLCFDDLLLLHGLDDKGGSTRYTLSAFDFRGDYTGWRASAEAEAGGRTCIGGLQPGSSHEGYTIVRIVTHRRGKFLGAALVHLALDPATHSLRVIGVHRR